MRIPFCGQRALGLRAAAVLVVTSSALVAAFASAASAGTTSAYIVLYKASSVPSDAAQAIQAAGGTLTYSYNAIGVVIASSSSDSFAANIQKDKKVEGTAATGGLGTAVDDAQRLYAKRFPDATDIGKMYRFYQFRPRRMKLFDEAKLGGATWVTARVGAAGALRWERTERYV